MLGGDPATPASDVYGLGATLHAALAGQAPFAGADGESFAARIGRVMTQPPPDLRALGVPAALATVVEAALAKDPAARPQTAEELQRRLEALTPADLAAGPPPDPATEVLAPVVPTGAPDLDPDEEAARRRRMLLVAGAVVAVLLLVGLGALALARSGDDEPDVAAGEATTTSAPASDPSTTASTTDPESTTEAAASTSPPSSLEEPTTTEATTTTSTTTTSEPAEPGTDKELRDALTDYYDTVDGGDLEAGYALLSPRYQQEQPFAGYQDFWEGIRSVSVKGRPDVDVEGQSVEATLHFVRTDGSTSDDGVRLTFVRDADGTLLIDQYANL